MMIQEIVKKAVSIGVFMLIAAILSAIVGLIMAVPVMFLWNWVMPYISNGFFNNISYFQAWALITLIGILFSSGKSPNGKD
jgi:mannitol-specific phosphotransferase system IIBC component